MNTQEIIKNIEAEQLKSEVDVFHVGDTVRVHAMIKRETVKEFRYLKVLLLRDRVEAIVRHLLLESSLTVLV